MYVRICEQQFFTKERTSKYFTINQSEDLWKDLADELNKMPTVCAKDWKGF